MPGTSIYSQLSIECALSILVVTDVIVHEIWCITTHHSVTQVLRFSAFHCKISACAEVLHFSTFIIVHVTMNAVQNPRPLCANAGKARAIETQGLLCTLLEAL